MDEGWVADNIFLDFSKAIDTVPCKTSCWCVDHMGRLWSELKNCQTSGLWVVVTSGRKSSWKPGMNRLSNGWILGLVLFKIFINGLDDGCQQVSWWHKTGRRCWYGRGHADMPEGPEQAGEMGWLDPIKFRKKCKPGEEQPRAPVSSAPSPAGKQLCRRGLGSPGGCQVEY